MIFFSILLYLLTTVKNLASSRTLNSSKRNISHRLMSSCPIPNKKQHGFPTPIILPTGTFSLTHQRPPSRRCNMHVIPCILLSINFLNHRTPLRCLWCLSSSSHSKSSMDLCSSLIYLDSKHEYYNTMLPIASRQRWSCPLVLLPETFYRNYY
jgi:hypothetical protein